MVLASKINWARLQKGFTDCASGTEEDAAAEQLGMSTGSKEPELNSYWFTSDHLGSSAFITDGSGVAIQHLEYMAFGEVFVDQRRTGFGTPYKFNAKELDCESGYYYYSARYYDPRMARFLSVDPLAGEMPEWGSYTYTFDNPIRLVDPTGMSPEDCPTCPGNADDGDTHFWGGSRFTYDNGSWGADLPELTLTASKPDKVSGDFSSSSDNNFGGGFWDWFSNLFSSGSTQSGTDDGIEGLGRGGSWNTPDGSADRIFDYTNFPGTNIPIASTIVMKNLRNINSDAYNGMNIVTSLAETVDFGLGTATKIQSGMIPRKENVVDTQIWISGDFIIRGKVKSYISADGKSWGAKGTIIDTPGILKK